MVELKRKTLEITTKKGEQVTINQYYVTIESKNKSYDYPLKLSYEQVEFLNAMLDYND